MFPWDAWEPPSRPSTTFRSPHSAQRSNCVFIQRQEKKRQYHIGNVPTHSCPHSHLCWLGEETQRNWTLAFAKSTWPDSLQAKLLEWVPLPFWITKKLLSREWLSCRVSAWYVCPSACERDSGHGRGNCSTWESPQRIAWSYQAETQSWTHQPVCEAQGDESTLCFFRLQNRNPKHVFCSLAVTPIVTDSKWRRSIFSLPWHNNERGKEKWCPWAEASFTCVVTTGIHGTTDRTQWKNFSLGQTQQRRRRQSEEYPTVPTTQVTSFLSHYSRKSSAFIFSRSLVCLWTLE